MCRQQLWSKPIHRGNGDWPDLLFHQVDPGKAVIGPSLSGTVMEHHGDVPPSHPLTPGPICQSILGGEVDRVSMQEGQHRQESKGCPEEEPVGVNGEASAEQGGRGQDGSRSA